MQVEVHRTVYAGTHTGGVLSIDGAPLCSTMEDVTRGPLDEKVPGETAIPYGEYHLVETWSEHFGRMMPLLVNVPGFSGVRIHWGNTAEDSLGCILVGMSTQKNLEEGLVFLSKRTFDLLWEKLSSAWKRGEEITIRIW